MTRKKVYLAKSKTIFVLAMFLFAGLQGCNQSNFNLKEQKKEAALNNFENFFKENFIKKKDFQQQFKKEFEPEFISAYENSESKTPPTHTKEQEAKAKRMLKPLLDNSKKLLAAYDFTEKDLPENADESIMVILGLLVFTTEKSKPTQQVQKASFLSGIFVQKFSKNWKNMRKIKECLESAIDFPVAISTVGIYMGLKRKHIMKAVGKFVGKKLGWIGVAWMVYDFVYCMEPHWFK